MEHRQIIESLPYSPPFLFVDELEEICETGVTGNYTFPADAYFYQGHFKNFPVTPGVILTECMAQIGLVCLGIFLLLPKNMKEMKLALTNTQVDFFLPVLPGEKVRVISEKIYFRFNKLKCSLKMLNNDEKIICKGEISGMISEK
ncbi:MAG TPA: hydroxymyristoyl-ACP dehydratase [Salinimicrobium sp.]|nr:hydroxymyristoyl-ACP dehydratase [Salinimicrobium sp.]